MAPPKREKPYGISALGDRLFLARVGLLDVSQQILADRAGAHREHYMSLEKGGNSGDSLSMMRRIARVYGASLDDLAAYAVDGSLTLKQFDQRRGRGRIDNGTFLSLSNRIGLPLDSVVTLASESYGDMDQLPPNVRKAVLGIVHLLGYPIETVIGAAAEALGDRGDMGLEPEALASIIRPKLPPKPPSGTFPSSSKIKISA